MKKLVISFCLPILSIVALTKYAYALPNTLNTANYSIASFSLANALAPQLYSSMPLLKGRWNTRIVPGYLTYDNTKSGEEQSLTGFGGALGVGYSLTDHWSINILALGFSATGTGIIKDTVTGKFGDNKASGYVTSLVGAWDYFNEPTRPQSFRMPLFLGVGYFSLSQAATATGGAGGTLTTEFKLNAPGVVAGIAPQFIVGSDFQLSAFLLTGMPFGDQTYQCTSTGNENCSSAPTTALSKSVGTAGLEFKYIPMDVSFAYAPSIGNASAITLKWEKTFGADAPAASAPPAAEPVTPKKTPTDSAPKSDTPPAN